MQTEAGPGGRAAECCLCVRGAAQTSAGRAGRVGCCGLQGFGILRTSADDSSPACRFSLLKNRDCSHPLHEDGIK